MPGLNAHPGPLVVAVDLSTTAAKAIAFDAAGATVAASRAPLETSSPEPTWQEQDAPTWWTATCAALRELTAQLGTAAIEAVTVTHQRETFVVLDEDGEPLRPAILWLDSRAGPQVERLGSPEVHAISGRPPSTTASLYKLAWLREHEPELMARAATVADVHAYLVRRLTGRWITSWASADPMGLVDLRTFGYSAPLLELAGLSAGQLPRLVGPGELVGRVTEVAAQASGLPPGTPVVAGAGDGQCAALGAAVTRPGEVSLNLGTSVTMATHADEFRIGRSFRTVASAEPGRWTLEAALASGVHSIGWFRRSILRDGSAAALEAVEADAARVAPGADGLLFLPYLVRAETPFWDPAARGAWVGLRDHHDLAHLYRAILEGIGLEQAMVLSMIEQETGVAATRIRVMGGGARSRLWIQVLADVFGRPIEVTEHAESTALGAAVLAAAGTGLEGQTDVAGTARRMSQGWREVPPSATGPERYRQLTRAYRRLYPALAEVFALLAD